MTKPAGTPKKYHFLIWVIIVVSAIVASVFMSTKQRKTELEDIDQADTPAELPASEWKRALLETKTAIANKNLQMFAAGVAYFATLAFFPTLVAIVSFYGLFAAPTDVVHAAQASKQYLPPQVSELIIGQLLPLAHAAKTSLGAGIIATLIALWSASSGAQNLIKALNNSYDVTETRGFFKLRAISLGLVLGLIVLGLPVFGLLLLQHGWLSVVRWPLLALIAAVALAVIYRYAPDRRNPKWQIVSWGGGAATLIWLIATVLFFVYVQHFANFSRTYGIFAGLIILMTWLNLSALIILVGAEVNNRLERHVDV